MDTENANRTDLAASLMTYGKYVFALGVMAIGALTLTWGDFANGQPVPAAFPDRTILAYLAGAFMFIAGAAILWRRTTAWAAAAIAAYFTVIVVIVMDGPGLIAQYTVYGVYEGIAIQLAIACGALIVFAANADIDAALAARLTRIAQLTFGVCALIFGGAHFVYLTFTTPFVPAWLPPSQAFWAYVTGVAHILAGIAILTGFRARLAAILLTIMFAAFQPLVHIPMLLAAPTSHFEWGENATNLALIGVAWLIAETLPRQAWRRWLPVTESA